MEEDEPDLSYEIAWVDNGSGRDVARVMERFQIEKAMPLVENIGLAGGLNALFFDMCEAPYVLILEEDWLYMDSAIAEQTDARKHAIRNGIEVTEEQATAHDGRLVMGAFLRPETYVVEHDSHHTTTPPTHYPTTPLPHYPTNTPPTHCPTTPTNTPPHPHNRRYETFLKPPHIGNWATTKSGVEYKPYCADSSGNSGYMWGSYTNGAGLYSRKHLDDIGPMYGEPGDGFHDAYVEANYAFRAGLKYCHAMLRLEPGCDETRGCNAAFYHIGGGRGTRPNRAKDIREKDDAWVVYGTPFYPSMKAQTAAARAAAGEQGGQAPNWEQSQRWRQEYQQETLQRNKADLEKEKAKR